MFWYLLAVGFFAPFGIAGMLLLLLRAIVYFFLTSLNTVWQTYKTR